MTACKRLTIFEGPDGGGKSTAAEAYARDTGALLVHHGPYLRCHSSLGRTYVETLLPALLGYQDVVLDRCWLSEVPYGQAFRGGQDRLGIAGRRMLERLAMRCATVVVRCLPPWEVVRTNYLKRKQIEMLENEGQLRQVYDLYTKLETDLPVVDYDFTKQPWPLRTDLSMDAYRTFSHDTGTRTAGSLEAKVVLVGESFADPKDQDSWYQWPFGSFSGAGCSRWLTERLATHHIKESDLLWCNADQPLTWLSHAVKSMKIIALGQRASAVLNEQKVPHDLVTHPQAWKRFSHNDHYPLIDLLRSYL